MDSFRTEGSGRHTYRSPRTIVMSVMIVVAMFAGMGLDRVLIETGIAATQLTQTDEFGTLEETYEAIREHYVLQGEISDQDLIYGASRGMVEALGDTGHSAFLDPEEAADHLAELEGGFVGIGVTVDTTGEFPVVIAPMQNSPALEAGILPGDTIIAVDGVSLEGIDPSEALDMVSGEAGTDVTLEIIHAGEKESFEVTITRQEIEVNPVSWVMLPDGVMWLQLSQFSSGATDELKTAIREAQTMGMTSLILDLRGNPGGYTTEAVGVASQFLPDDTPLYQESDADGNTNVVETRGSRGVFLEGEMVVIVDEQSASSAEIVAAALRDSGRAPLYGQTTFGVGTVTLPYELSDGSFVILGIKQLLTGAGERIFQVGVEPTDPVELGVDQRPGFILSEDPDQTRALSQEQLQGIEDDQLHAAYDAIVPVAP